jgi:hypothetical protein
MLRMTPEFLQSTFAMAAKLEIGMKGEMVTFRRLPSTDVTVRAKVSGYKPDELGGGIQQGDRKILVNASDIPFDPALKRGDKAIAVAEGRLLNIEIVDSASMRAAGVLMITARG